MSLQAQPIPPIPELTVRIARAAFRKGNVYMQMRDLLGTFFTDEKFLNRTAVRKPTKTFDRRNSKNQAPKFNCTV